MNESATVDIRITRDELAVINNCLNELSNGIHFEDWEFQTRIGWSRGQVRELLSRLSAQTAEQS